jgi:hypothetical protein
MSPNDVLARDLLEKSTLLDSPPAFDPVGHYDITVAAKKGLCGEETTLVIALSLAKLPDGTYAGTIQIGADKGKAEALTKIDVAADRLWLSSDSASLRLIVGADGQTLRGRYVGGFAANFPLTGKRASVR